MTTLFSVVLLLAIGISVLLFAILIDNSVTQKRTKKLLFALDEAANKYGLWFSKQDVIGSRVIAFDEDRKKLLFLWRTKNKYDDYLVDLAEIENFDVKTNYVARGAPYIRHLGADASIESVTLRLRYARQAKTLHLPFYEKAKDPIYELGNRTELAGEWQLLLSSKRNEQDDGVDVKGLAPADRLTATV